MKIKLHNLFLPALALTLLLLPGCNMSQTTLAEEFQPIENKTWKWSDSKSFTFTVDDTTHYYNFSIGLRIQGTYAYSNIWMISQIQGNNTNIKEQVQVEIADQTGRWLGKGMSNLITYLKPIYVQKKLAAGTYTWSLSQNMRDELLNGIVDVGIKVEKGQPIL
ncbi:MAG: gliding motility lipoprotein GldH [Bacteroidota bacterium]|jgi:gliding motility-associated lipoprotein GldH|nr:gliding motility lipoprotein GldH [Bacteroidia bacterium]